MAERRRLGCPRPKRSGRRRLAFERLEDRNLLSLTHLYTFNDGLANDWIGSTHASLINGATVVDGQLVLNNVGLTSGSASVQYARLGANLLPSGDATVEVWFTTLDSADWARVFSIGSQSSYLAFTPQSGQGDSRATLLPFGGTAYDVTTATTDDGTEHMAAIVIDSSADLLRLYIDGNEVATTALDGAHAGSVSDTLAYFGRSPFSADAGFTGSINELRVYDEARGPDDIAADAAAGTSTATKSPLVRQMEYLNRGVVAVQTGNSSVYVGWRLLGTDPADIAFNLYRSENGGAPVRLNAAPLTQTTDFTDTTAATGLNTNADNSYFVRPVVGGIEQAPSESFTLLASTPTRQYLSVPLQRPPGGVVTPPAGTVMPIPEPPQGGPAPLDYTYSANDASVGDLDGDGQYEIVLKWDPSNSRDNAHEGLTGPTIFDAYRLDGELLWRINLGRNIRAGAHYSPFLVYDFDGDGRAEVVMRTADGTIDGTGQVIGDPNADYRDTYTGGGDGRWGRVLTGPEYLTVFDGLTGKALATIPFSPPRGSVSSWGDSYGNRVDRFLATVAYLDGVHPSIVMTRGYYAKTRLTAFDWRDGQLTQRWVFDSSISGNSAYGGQGNHNLSVADVDGDGKDEIIYGAAVFNDDGTGLYSTGYGHGDALHVTDLDPTRPGLEVFQPHESQSAYGPNALSLIDAATGELLLGVAATGDIGRGLALDVDPRYPGYELWGAGGTGGMYTVTLTAPDPVNGPRGVQIANNKPSINFGVWWDADPLRELLDGTTISKWNWPSGSGNGSTTTLLSPSGVASNNSTKANPSLSADLFGDWREEVIWRNSNNTELRIYTTTIPATNRLYTLMHDSQYRQAIAWQNAGYNQPPHPSYFLGDGMADPPVPQIYTVQYVAPLPGDFNGDRRVDGGDYVTWRNHLGDPDESALHGGGNGVGGVDLDDYLWWKQHYGMNGDQGTGSGGLSSRVLLAGTDSSSDATESVPNGELGALPWNGFASLTSPIAAGPRISNDVAAPAELVADDLLLLLLDTRTDDESSLAREQHSSTQADEPSVADTRALRDDAWAGFRPLSAVRRWPAF